MDGILACSRAGRNREERTRVDLDAVVRNTIDLLAPPPHIEIVMARPLPALTMEPFKAQQVFQLFQTLAPRDRIEGTGVGLALVKKIVAVEGGSIWIESTPGIGSTFHLTLARSTGEAPSIPENPPA